MFVTWAFWIAPFFLRGGKTEKAVKRVSTARWGIILQSFGFMLVFLHSPRQSPREWSSPLEPWRCGIGIIPAILAILLSWRSVPVLGRQWRIDAGLNADHELVRSGPYSIVRHPIYASMLGMLLAGIAWAGTLPAWPIALVLFVIGIEIRVRVEDNLLRERFGAEFTEWSRQVPAYLPFIR
jgi:protein-S-isoprenylcysteine O-methyltransferase Ste14